MILCKYYSLDDNIENCYGYINLKQKQLVAPITSELNDVFECMPFFNNKICAKKFCKIFNITVEEIIKTKEYKEYVRKLLKYRDDFSIISMTKQYNNLTMWAHYANSHKGICVKYDIDQDFLKQHDDKMAQIIKVKYQKNRIELDLDVLTVDPSKELDYKALVAPLITKSTDWKYENEYRIVFVPKDLELESRTLKNVKIVAVYFGYRISDDNKNKMLNLLKTDNYKGVNVFQAVLSETKFKLKMVKV